MFQNNGADKIKYNQSKYSHKITLIRKLREVQKNGYTRGVPHEIFDTETKL